MSRFGYSILALAAVLTAFGLASCDPPEETGGDPSGYDRSVLLTDWADGFIIPAYEVYQSDLTNLETAKEAFLSQGNTTNLDQLREAYLEVYRSWQAVAMFEIGEAETIGLTNYTNVFPTDGTRIESNIAAEDYNLELPSNFVAQGLPALDYLLYGTGDSKEAIINKLAEDKYANYLSDLVDRLVALTGQVVNSWNNGFREEFIANDGASATAAVDKLINDFLFYYERHLRAGKIAIPGGVFTGDVLPSAVEAPYSKVYSGELFLLGMQATRDFFQGTSSYVGSEVESIQSYLEFVHEGLVFSEPGEKLSERIVAGFDEAFLQGSLLNQDFAEQVRIDNTKMLEVYDLLQSVVPLMKVDMMQALNIQVDFIDADGD